MSETRYVAVGDADVAYRVVGDGPFDLLYCYGLGSHVDMHSDGSSKLGQFLDALASFSRLIFFDRRGTGASDGLARNAMPAWEEWAEDVRAVLDAAGSDRTAIFGGNDAGPIAMMFAALQPERVSALILANTSARYLEADGYPIGMSQAVVDVVVETVGSLWGTEQFSAVVNPGRADDVELARSARTLRASATPRNAAAQYRYILENLDVRSVLRLIQAPTLVLHSSHDPLVNLDHGRYLADHIPGAKFVEIPGHGHLHDEGELALVFGEIAEFLTGERPVVDVDRVLTTVLFTDIVASTQQLTSVGDRRWRSLLDAHDRAVREQLRRFRGREIKTTGDGFAACFDGPGRAIACATSIIEVTRALGIDVRAGLHTGECEVRGDELAGVAVHLAARIESLASGGEVLVSTTVKDLVAGSGIEFADKGEHQLKGIPATWKLFAVADFGHQRQSGTRDRAPLGRPVRDDR